MALQEVRMFVVCPSCAGNGEGVFGHSWTDCPLCHGAGEIVQESQRIAVLGFDLVPVEHCRTPVRVAPRVRINLRPIRPGQKPVTADALDPTEVFPQR